MVEQLLEIKAVVRDTFVQYTMFSREFGLVVFFEALIILASQVEHCEIEITYHLGFFYLQAPKICHLLVRQPVSWADPTQCQGALLH